eukprot:4390569-Pyramimonas_sp.AAC.1
MWRSGGEKHVVFHHRVSTGQFAYCYLSSSSSVAKLARGRQLPQKATRCMLRFTCARPPRWGWTEG